MGDPPNGNDDLAARQAKLSKALSAAYLNHQIAELESKVKATTLTPPNERSVPVSPKPAPQQPVGGIVERDPNDDLGRPDDVEDPTDDEDEDWRVVVVDVSALMWAKNAVKRLVGKGLEVIVPLEAIRTLDLLKKGPSPSAVSARQAARYIEHATRFHALLSSDPSITVQSGTNYKKGRGLRIQREEEVLPVTSMIDELAIPPMDGFSSLSIWVKKVFSCVAYFKRITDKESELHEVDVGDSGLAMDIGRGPILYVGNPPVFVEVEQSRINEPIPSDHRGIKEDYTARAEGHVILEEAARFDLMLEVLRDDDHEVEASAMSRSGGGRGKDKKGDRRRRNDRSGAGEDGHGHGHGSGQRKKKEQVPEAPKEVKILLRRPPSVVGVGLSDEHPSPESGKSTLPTSANSPAIPGPHLKPKEAHPIAIMARPPPPSSPMSRHDGHGPRLPPPLTSPHHHGHGMRPPPPPPPPFGMRPPPQYPHHRGPHPPPGPPHHHHMGHGLPRGTPGMHDFRPPPPPLHHRPPPFDRSDDRKGHDGGGGGGRGRDRRRGERDRDRDRRSKPNNSNEFVLLQRPESLVRPPVVNPGANARIDIPESQTDSLTQRAELNEKNQARGGGRLSSVKKEEAPKIVLLRRPG
ncbi:uncharacterized protein I303_102835 [Kwoniella dejecticola CBS 10117]|uniref:PIN domain-containing protein n=1 Tax=Kwoniella dejecticola CBS 10117 TaxID=1296121 RepID=A0A1A6A9V3_9TREE|nr:uncharacterized protein I303_02849 [Kwoniella dejecticola CBS 10117]OBR86833.1 hypothetical protein I303_02849 [Kwoniella dejecticola CBS 10117]